MSRKKLVFWQNIVSPHQAFFLNEIGRRFEVILIVEDYMSRERQSQGWEVPRIPSVAIVKIASGLHLSELIEQYKGQYNFFSGFLGMGCPNLREASMQLIRYQRIYIITECPILLGKKRFFKILKYRFLYYRYGKNIAHIFAMGNLGRDFFVDIGFDSQKVTSFQYFIERSVTSSKVKSLNRKRTRFIFVGQLIFRKGIDILIDAFHDLGKDDSWELVVIGSGQLEVELRRIVKDYGFENLVYFKGNVNNVDVRSQIEDSDYLILPSRFDGWGAVISEALSVGTKVICSSKCGAAVLIDSANGYIYDGEIGIRELSKVIRMSLADRNYNRTEIVDKFFKRSFEKIEEFISALDSSSKRIPF